MTFYLFLFCVPFSVHFGISANTCTHQEIQFFPCVGFLPKVLITLRGYGLLLDETLVSKQFLDFLFSNIIFVDDIKESEIICIFFIL